MVARCSHVGPARQLKGGLQKKYVDVLQTYVFPTNLREEYEAGVRLAHSKAVCEREGCTVDRNLLVVCYDCVWHSCGQHFRAHAASSGHAFAVSLHLGYVYCVECLDFVYDNVLEARRLEYHEKYLKSKGISPPAAWIAKKEEISGIPMQNCVNLADQEIRGLMNLGNTCFLNCIIQALVHTPSLRDYFLGYQHTKCKYVAEGLKRCIVCVMDKIVQALNITDWTEPFMATELLVQIWLHTQLEGYHQQDAHEALVSLLHMMHEHEKPINSDVAQSIDCKCVFDKLFAGILRSELVCDNCGNQSEKFDGMQDIALHIPADMPDGSPMATLEKCIDRYVQRETMHCTKCKKCQLTGLSKQLTFARLPPVLVFQLKRFEHMGMTRKKITSKIRFPKRLDMTNYLTSYKDNPHRFDKRDTNSMLSREYDMYDLHAVVQHMGSMDTGHYICYVRRKKDWFKCDDDLVLQVSEKEVLNSEAYLLFYQTSSLKFNMVPTSPIKIA